MRDRVDLINFYPQCVSCKLVFILQGLIRNSTRYIFPDASDNADLYTREQCITILSLLHRRIHPYIL